MRTILILETITRTIASRASRRGGKDGGKGECYRVERVAVIYFVEQSQAVPTPVDDRRRLSLQHLPYPLPLLVSLVKASHHSQRCRGRVLRGMANNPVSVRPSLWSRSCIRYLERCLSHSVYPSTTFAEPVCHIATVPCAMGTMGACNALGSVLPTQNMVCYPGEVRFQSLFDRMGGFITCPVVWVLYPVTETSVSDRVWMLCSHPTLRALPSPRPRNSSSRPSANPVYCSCGKKLHDPHASRKSCSLVAEVLVDYCSTA